MRKVKKEICQRCWEMNSNCAWGESHEFYWSIKDSPEHTGVFCPSLVISDNDDFSVPPCYCPFKLEHEVLCQ